ncbi:MAG: LLM class flavin-dependent oxidoreductase [Chloroflexi bacterium]|nr:LLM class flavin-dependent oxidoreductase [Chloroflexota bacterium]
MKLGNFLFPESRTPESDFEAVNDALAEAQLSDELGFDAVWLGEHHFDGACAYVDPTTFAGAVAATTKRVKIGFSAVQMALHHPVRLAEQVALLDNLSNGRVILGTGRGTAFNFYEYRGYGIPFEEAQERLVEAEEVIVKAWTTPDYRHEGKFWKLQIPVLRPRVLQDPHPPIVRAVASEGTMLEMARQGRPFMLVNRPDDETKRRFELYRKAMSEAGFDEEAVARSMDDCWIWRNVIVAETDAEAEALAVKAYHGSRDHINGVRERLNTTAEQSSLRGEMADPRHTFEHGVIFGSPDTVTERLDRLRKIGMGGLIIHFRLGPLSRDANENSLRLFAARVAPELNRLKKKCGV